MTDNDKLHQLAETYKKFRSENPNFRTRLPQEVHQLAAELAALDVDADKIAAACDVSRATAYNWIRFKKREKTRRSNKRPPGFVIRRPGSSTVAKPALSHGDEGLAVHGAPEAVVTRSGEISLLINGLPVQGQPKDLRKLLGFDNP